MSNISVSNKLDYKLRDYSHPKYKLHRIIQQNGGSNVVLTPAGGQESVFEIPAKVFNLSKCKLRGNFFIPPLPLGVLRNNYIYNSQVAFISEVQLYNAAGMMVCDLKYANNYTDIVSKPETTQSDFLSNGTGDLHSNFLHRNNDVKDNVVSRRYDDSIATLNFTEHKYFNILLADPGDPNANPVIPPLGLGGNLIFTLPLSSYKNTILSLDKDIFFGETMFLRVRWAPTTKIAWTSEIVIDGAGVVTYNPNENPLPYNNNIIVQNLQLYMAYEDDVAIQNAVMAQYSAGMTYRIPYVWSSKTSLTGTTQNVTIRMGPGQGRRLKRIYHSFYNVNEFGNSAYDHSNVGNFRCEQFYTMLNNARRQEFDINPNNLDDWLINQDRFKDCVIQAPEIFLYNYFVMDDFTEDDCIDSTNNKQVLNLDCGTPITADLKWDIYCQIPNAMPNNQLQNHYTFSIVSRDLYIGPGGMNLN